MRANPFQQKRSIEIVKKIQKEKYRELRKNGLKYCYIAQIRIPSQNLISQKWFECYLEYLYERLLIYRLVKLGCPRGFWDKIRVNQIRR